MRKISHWAVAAVVLLAIFAIVYGMTLRQDTTTAAVKSTHTQGSQR